MFDRLINLIGEDNFAKVTDINVAVIGIGGVGGFALEALIRSGINNITIFDGDKIDISNLNRQIISNSLNINEYKVDEALKRAKSINPEINIKACNIFINSANVDTLKDYDYIIDACDDIKAKVAIIKYCLNNNIKLICALGLGKRLDPSKVTITRLDKTSNDPLAKKLRQILRKEGYSLKIPVVYHEDLPLNNETLIASSIFPVAVAGTYLAYYVVSDILNKKDSNIA